MKKRKLVATFSTITALSALGLVFFVTLHNAQAGPITNGGGNPPFTKLGVYQGVIAIVPGSAGDSVMEIGNQGRDIKSTGAINLVPATGSSVSFKGAGTGTGLFGPWGGGVNYTAIGLAGSVAAGAYNFTSSPTDTNLYINRPTGSGIHFRENNGSQVYIAPGGFVGIGNTQPSSLLDMNGALTVRQIAAPAVPLLTDNRGRIYYDSTSKKFRVSENGNAYVDLVSGASVTPSLDQVLSVANGNRSDQSMGLGRDDIVPVSTLVINKGLGAVNHGGATNAVSIIASSTGSALYAEQALSTGWAGFFSGRVNITGDLTYKGRVKPTPAIQVCRVGTDTCLGPYLRSTGTTQDRSGTGLAYWYNGPGEVQKFEFIYGQVSHTCTGGATLRERTMEGPPGPAGTGRSYFSNFSCTEFSGEFMNNQDFQNGALPYGAPGNWTCINASAATQSMQQRRDSTSSGVCVNSPTSIVVRAVGGAIPSGPFIQLYELR